jgi:tRNA threonylcarbamoyl adenosine modification protein (Sua5/YciO/YrdC/YwlC family)
MLLELHAKNPQVRLLEKIARCLKNDGIIIYPTDTCYGIGCSIFSKKAVDRIFSLRKFSKNKALSIICSDISDIANYAVISDLAYRNMKRLVPGPYTFILPATRQVPKLLANGKRKDIGIRIPDNIICAEIVRTLGHPLLSAGAVDRDDEEMSINPYELFEYYENQVDYVVDGGIIGGGYSTVIQFEYETVEIIREGLGPVDFL